MIRNPSKGWPKPPFVAPLRTEHLSSACPGSRRLVLFGPSCLSHSAHPRPLCALVPEVTNLSQLELRAGRTQAADGAQEFGDICPAGLVLRTLYFSLAKFLGGKEAPPVFSGSVADAHATSLPGDCAWGRGCGSAPASGRAALGAELGGSREADVRTFD